MTRLSEKHRNFLELTIPGDWDWDGWTFCRPESLGKDTVGAVVLAERQL